MSTISRDTTIEELATLVSVALEAAGLTATLSGGAAVTIYAENEYLSGDLDFVTNARITKVEAVMSSLGFTRRVGARQFEHPDTELYVEFPPGPLAFGETAIPDEDAARVVTPYGMLRIVTPTQLVMDRLAAYVNWRDGQSYDQAVMVAKRQDINWDELMAWAEREGADLRVVEQVRAAASA